MRREFSCAASPEYSLAMASKTSCLTRCWADASSAVKQMHRRRKIFMPMRVQESSHLANTPCWYSAFVFSWRFAPAFGKEEESHEAHFSARLRSPRFAPLILGKTLKSCHDTCLRSRAVFGIVCCGSEHLCAGNV